MPQSLHWCTYCGVIHTTIKIIDLLILLNVHLDLDLITSFKNLTLVPQSTHVTTHPHLIDCQTVTVTKRLF
jgi:hypothetical protein